jgi:regulator of replication initiation timing
MTLQDRQEKETTALKEKIKQLQQENEALKVEVEKLKAGIPEYILSGLTNYHNINQELQARLDEAVEVISEFYECKYEFDKLIILSDRAKQFLNTNNNSDKSEE